MAQHQLIEDKISFLSAYPSLSRERGRGLDYLAAPAPGSEAGIKKRVALLLGNPEPLERMIVVEHLLLRPKFPGDALYPACTDGACALCGAEDPYSFRLTFVMPGWGAPFNTDMEMRGFAERSVRQETPSHLLPKICWVANDGFEVDLHDPVIVELAELLEELGLTAEGERPTDAETCDCAAEIYKAFSAFFLQWYEGKEMQLFQADLLKTELQTQFAAEVDPSAISCSTILAPALWSEVLELMVGHFAAVALHGLQFERFEGAWFKWLEINAPFDWSEERLQERLEAVLAGNVLSGGAGKEDALCRCAAAILAQYGAKFHAWNEARFPEGDFGSIPPASVDLTGAACAGIGFKEGTAAAIDAMLQERYAAYSEVSYRLWVVLHLLSRLSNSYPAATLHDFDEGDDRNPVRLGKTALGS